jgi:hypothetical protein
MMFSMRKDIMARYEFRILSPEGSLAQILGCNQTSDFAAVRYATTRMPANGGVEVWRGMECIYARYAQDLPRP